jgi:hypothetical protein
MALLPLEPFARPVRANLAAWRRRLHRDELRSLRQRSACGEQNT